MRAHRHFESLLEFIMSSFAIGMDFGPSRTIGAMARAVVRLLPGVFGLLLCSSSCLAGGIPPVVENFIASTLAPSQDFSVLYPLYGHDTASYIIQNEAYAPSGWSNSISSTYDSRPYSLSYGGSDPTLNTVTWAGSGTYGASQITTSGTLQFNNNNTFDLSISGKIGTTTYSMIAEYQYNYTPNSSTYLTYTGSGSAYFGGQLAGTFTAVEQIISSIQTLLTDEHWNPSGSPFPGEDKPETVINSPPLIPAPEIDPGSMAGALTFLIGGVLTLTGRRRRQSLSLAACGAR